ncbi:hypothetical protein E2C01_030372 [Portunus trituberculatus]|uniref:Uncharacterized protein n=1 Tax=Portunus trituberculatus TaxID=210409 RepID=A0A5B7EVJ1_PORTR|nr:hypothetical protein [Portunus trituberculatus]
MLVFVTKGRRGKQQRVDKALFITVSVSVREGPLVLLRSVAQPWFITEQRQLGAITIITTPRSTSSLHYSCMVTLQTDTCRADT